MILYLKEVVTRIVLLLWSIKPWLSQSKEQNQLAKAPQKRKQQATYTHKSDRLCSSLTHPGRRCMLKHHSMSANCGLIQIWPLEPQVALIVTNLDTLRTLGTQLILTRLILPIIWPVLVTRGLINPSTEVSLVSLTNFCL